MNSSSNSFNIYKFLYTNFDAPYSQNFKIDSKTRKLLIQSGYLNFYEIVTVSDPFYFRQSTNLTSRQYLALEKSLSEYNLSIGICYEQLSQLLRIHARPYYYNKVFYALSQIVRQQNKEKYITSVINTRSLIILYGEEFIEDNCYEDYLQYLRYQHLIQ